MARFYPVEPSAAASMQSRGFSHGSLATIVFACALLALPSTVRAWDFNIFTLGAGFNYQHGYVEGVIDDEHDFAGGVAVGDYNKDGYLDVYVVRGNIGPNLLFKNKGNGTFQEVGASAGVAVSGAHGCGPAFGDIDGDGWLDLVIGGIANTAPKIFKNNANGTFTDVTTSTGIAYARDTYSTTFADYDRDGDLDLFMTHWGSPQFEGGHLWRNNGDGTFTDAEAEAGLSTFGQDLLDYTYVANFADINDDDWPDLLLTSDFHNSEIYLNDGDGTFTNVTTAVISDDNGMGAAVGDYDDDGDLDWFCSSKSPPPSSAAKSLVETGNRLYRNLGGGVFDDVTDSAGVRVGYWGWGSSFADYDNDGHLDIYQVNGMHLVSGYEQDRSRMFVGEDDGSFTEMGVSLGCADNAQGRGVASFDFDRDGDLDIFVATNSQAPILYRNRGGNALNWITIKLKGTPPNTEGIGARVLLTRGGVTQLRELRAGSNYVSQDPAEAHFGLGSSTRADEIRIEWPNGQVDVYNNIAANYYLVFDQAGMTGVGDGARDAEAPVILEGAGPNPLVRDTVIRYRLASDAWVTLRVFDASGRVTRTLVDRIAAAGDHATHWDGRDSHARDVAAGVYFYRLDAMGAGSSGKIMVVR